ncbi:hypothetical protein [Arhodomonas sp. SL1]|uniref:hypothetical protein n=1 Tax=Arhodomonas sp. SL1 TaxID=3425691 RepID=UPI003F88442F
MQNLRRPGIGERLQQLAYLLKHTFTIVGRNPGIVRPWVFMAVYAAVLVCVFFAAITAIAVDRGGLGTLLLLLAVALFFYKYFFYNRLEIRQSWLVAESVQGRPTTPEAAGERVGELKGSYRRLALLDMIFAYVAWQGRRQSGEKQGLMGSLVSALLAGLTEVWDLVNHYLLPAVAVDGLRLRDGIERMKGLREQVPETLMGVFGIDLAARAVGTLMAPLYLIAAATAVVLGLWVGDAVPAFHAGSLREALGPEATTWLSEGPLHFSWLPALIAFWVSKVVSAVFERLVTSVKVIYFTIFYMRITHPERITDEIRDELEAYLRLEGTDPATGPATEPSAG